MFSAHSVSAIFRSLMLYDTTESADANTQPEVGSRTIPAPKYDINYNIKEDKNEGIVCLYLHEQPIADEHMQEVIQFLNQHPEINKLDLSYTKTTNKAAKELAAANITTLKHLHLSTHMDDNAIIALMQAGSYESLNCSKITKISAKAIAKSALKKFSGMLHDLETVIEISASKSITDLSIDYSNLGDDAVAMLIDKLALVSLSAAMNGVGQNTATAIGNSKTLVTVFLGEEKNILNDSFAIAIASTQSIQNLSLINNAVTTSGAIALASIKTLKTLNFQKNSEHAFQFGHKAAIALLSNNYITDLSLSGYEGTPAMADCILNSRTLAKVSIQWCRNRVPKNILEKVKERLNENALRQAAQPARSTVSSSLTSNQVCDPAHMNNGYECFTSASNIVYRR